MNLLRHLRGLGDDSDTKVGCFQLWKTVFLDSRMRDVSSYPKLRDYNIYASSGAMFSGKDNVTYYYTIDGYPTELYIGFRKALRREVSGSTKISFISLFEGTRIDWNSAQVRSKLKTWKIIDEDSDDVDEFNMRENITMLDRNDWRKESLKYLSDAEVRRKRNLFKYRTMVVISGKRGEGFDTTIANVTKYCADVGVALTRVDGSIQDFLRLYSPFSLETSSHIVDKVGNTTITDELLARFSGYDQGKVGNGGMYWGTDIYSGFPVFKLVKKNSVDAENILVTAETGGGKSFFVKVLILQFLGDPNFTGTINDIEGFEYLPIAGFLANNDSVVVLNMAEGQGKYYDPVEIVLTGDESLDRNMFSFSKSYTIAVLKTLIGKRIVETNEWVDVIVNGAVSKTYSSKGVTLDKSTWLNSKGLTLFDVYNNMKFLYDEVINIEDKVVSDGRLDLVQNYKYNEGYRDALDLVIARLSAYFEPLDKGGTRSDVFQGKVSLEDIKNAKLVVCSFGMAGKSPDMVDPIQMALTQLSAANISYLRSLFSQARGKYNFKVWEEFQRWGSFPDSEKTITTALTGGRKLGDVNLIITNNVQELLDTDRFGIFQNTTSFAIGAIGDSKTRSELCERLSIPLLKPDLDRIVTSRSSSESFSGEDEVANIYDKAFLVNLDKTDVAISKMDIPDHIAKSVLFRTGDISQMKVID